MKVSIGILTWNEATHIRKTLETLFAQDLIKNVTEKIQIDIVCVTNGSTDNTSEIAELFFSEMRKTLLANNNTIKCWVHSIEEIGKANAWNVFIHEVSDPQTDYYILMDGDIKILNPSTLSNMIMSLKVDPQAIVSSDYPIKDLELKKNKNFLEFLSIQIGNLNRSSQGLICGQLYCIIGSFGKRLWMPKELLIEDGFIKEMVTTNFLMEPINNKKIIKAPNANHSFESYVRISDIYRHLFRQAIGQSMYAILKKWLLEYMKEHKGEDIGILIKNLNQNDPKWLINLVHKYCIKKYWVVYPGALSYRFRNLKQMSFFQRCCNLPWMFLGLAADLPVILMANQRLKHLTSLQNIWVSK